MSKECNFSFDNLFAAAHGREWSEEGHNQFDKLSQSEKNALVKEWKKMAEFITEDRVGSDSLIYTAFWQNN